jgi:hypothetical protein
MESGLGQKAFFITLGGPKADDSSVEKHLQEGPRNCRSLRFARDDKGKGTVP